jgi:anti-anti-sigma factor
MLIDLRKEGSSIVIAIKGRMDAVCAPDLDKLLDEEIKEGELFFIFDFSDLEYISSAGLQCILAAAKTLEGRQGRIALTSLRGTVKEVFEISGFDTLFPIYASVTEAIRRQQDHE